MITLTAVINRAQNRYVHGKPSNFTPAQVGALRRALRQYHAEMGRTQEKWSQGRTALQIGVSQQIAGKLIGPLPGGLSYPTATRIAQLSGFDTVEEFFAARMGEQTEVDARGHRELAVSLARRAGVVEAAIAAVLDRYKTSQFDSRPTKWWLQKLIAEDNDMEPLPTNPPPEPQKQDRASEPKRTRRAG